MARTYKKRRRFVGAGKGKEKKASLRKGQGSLNKKQTPKEIEDRRKKAKKYSIYYWIDIITICILSSIGIW